MGDMRRGKNSHYIMADIGMAAFSPFFMQSPSFLAHQRHLADGHRRVAAGDRFALTDSIESDSSVQEIIKPAYLPRRLRKVAVRYVFMAEDLLRRAGRHRDAVSICNADSKRRGAHGQTGKTTGGKA
jgi:hypothetical protein